MTRLPVCGWRPVQARALDEWRADNRNAPASIGLLLSNDEWSFRVIAARHVLGAGRHSSFCSVALGPHLGVPQWSWALRTK